MANSEQENYLGVWDAINERAEARIKIKSLAIYQLATTSNVYVGQLMYMAHPKQLQQAIIFIKALLLTRLIRL